MKKITFIGEDGELVELTAQDIVKINNLTEEVTDRIPDPERELLGDLQQVSPDYRTRSEFTPAEDSLNIDGGVFPPLSGGLPKGNIGDASTGGLAATVNP